MADIFILVFDGSARLLFIRMVNIEDLYRSIMKKILSEYNCDDCQLQVERYLQILRLHVMMDE